MGDEVASQVVHDVRVVGDTYGDIGLDCSCGWREDYESHTPLSTLVDAARNHEPPRRPIVRFEAATLNVPLAPWRSQDG